MDDVREIGGLGDGPAAAEAQRVFSQRNAMNTSLTVDQLATVSGGAPSPPVPHPAPGPSPTPYRYDFVDLVRRAALPAQIAAERIRQRRHHR